MNKEYLLEVLYSVFVLDTDTFLRFIECERTFAFWFPKNERKKIHLDIIEQLEYVLKKREDASDASSKIVDLLDFIETHYKNDK